MFCPKCGTALSDQAKFCPKCGTSLSGFGVGVPDSPAPASPAGPVEQVPTARAETSTAVADKPVKTRKSKAPLIVAVVVVLVAALVAGAVFLLPRLTTADAPEGSTSPVQSETENPTPAPSETGNATPAPTSSLNQAAVTELLALIDGSEEFLEKKGNELLALGLDEVDVDENFDFNKYIADVRQGVQIMNDTTAELAKRREDAKAIKGLDSKMTSARDEYFDMLYTSMSAYAEATAFLADYLDFYLSVAIYRPYSFYYDNQTEYAQALNTWTQLCRQGYSAISYPSCVESEWKQYGELLEYNGSIVQKLAQAIQYNDWLRYYSTLYMTYRYDVMQANRSDKIVNCTIDEGNYANYQQEIASQLAEEMHAYAELAQGEREAYKFKNIRSGEVSLEYETVDTIYPALYNTYDALVIVKTGCISGMRSIVVEAEIEGFTQQYRQSFDLDSSYRTIYIKPPVLTGDLNLSSARSAQLKITVSEKDGTLIDAKTFPVTIKSKNDVEWYSDEYGVATQDNILCYLTPEADAITELKRRAIAEITSVTGGQIESFPGYQEVGFNHYVVTYLQAAGLMNALYEMGVRYTMDAFSLSGSHQHVLFPEEVIRGGTGLCIETSLVIASALQSAGMHAFLVFPPGHAQVAVEVWNNGQGQGEYFLIETTALNDASNNKQHFIENANKLINLEPSTGIITYYSADNWANYLANNVEYLIDCDDSQLLGLTAFVN